MIGWYREIKHLLRKPYIAEPYSKSISQYMEKGHIQKVSPDEKQPKKKVVFASFRNREAPESDNKIENRIQRIYDM